MKQIALYKLKSSYKGNRKKCNEDDYEICDYALVDDEDVDKCMQYRWFKSSTRYSTTFKNFMHRFIMNAQKGQMIDHINGNRLDNRKENLRICNNSENHMNLLKPKTYANKKTSSKYKGVYWHKIGKKWMSYITKNSKMKNLGLYDSEIEAAKAYNDAALNHFGEFANLNKIEE